MSDLLQRASAVLSPVIGHYTSLEVKSGSGCYLYGLDDTAYLDLAAGIAVTATGHCHPKVVEAIQTQAATLIHASIGIVYYEPPIRLAEKLGELLGADLTSVFFCQSGTEAIEASMKLAKYVTKKSKLLVFSGGFHGRTLGALSLTTSKEKYRENYEPLIPGIKVLPYPNLYRHSSADSATAERQYISDLEAYFSTLDDDIAAVVIEPMLGEGGYLSAPAAFLQKLESLCRQKNILVILDEIQTGFGRTGHWFMFQEAGLKPDIIALAKGIASGMPLGACVARKALMEQWTTGSHGGTYGSNPVTCAAALASIDVIGDCLPGISELGEYALTFLKAALKDHPYVGDIRGKGLMIGIELVSDRITKEPHTALLKTVLSEALARQVIVISCGVFDNVIRIMPPLIITKPELTDGLTVITEVLNAHC